MHNKHSFLSGGGEMGARMRAHDWGRTPFGPPDTWPQSLKSAISICINSPVLGAVLWGPDMRMFYNDAYIQSMAERHPLALGCPVAEVWDMSWKAVELPFCRLMETGEGFGRRKVELPMVRHGQLETTFWDITASPIRGEDGTIVGLYNQGFEITSRVIAEREREAAETQLRQLNGRLTEEVSIRTEERNLMWDTAPDLMVIIDFKGIFQRVNPSWTRVLGYTAVELVGHHINEFVIPEDHSAAVKAYESAATGHQPRIINRYRHKDGSVRWFAWAAAPAGKLTYATGRDITLEKEREAELEIAQEQLRQSQKMEAVGQLTGGLAHDFNNLLTAISASLELISLRIDQNRHDQVHRYIVAAKEASKRAASLTHRLLAFSRRQTLAPQPVDPDQLIKGMLELICRTVGPMVTVKHVEAAQRWTALVDASQLENALLNLCINARDAMPGGGRILIETSSLVCGKKRALEQDMPAGEYLQLTVSDTGGGMSPDVAARAFDPFFTTKPTGMGTGLGLSMIYGFAKQSGGQVRLTSTPGAGTQVAIYLPRHASVAGAEGTSPSEAAPPIGAARETILVVDDEAAVRMLVTDVLHDLGYKTVEAEDGLAGLEIMRSDQRIDLLVTDVGLPGGMNGRQLADAGRVLRPKLPVLFITGYAEQALFEDANAESEMAILTKPFAIATLASGVRELLKR
ncbi:PAS domain-containing sensor histidine kinase [Pseudomonas sp. OIL-1]|uniref:hybrid sensor histidine kinase/response regulator n=1 Tax=Pseudomonas sp. OIL-1 TaxID=2706126 RepID=UPI0013A7A2A3|nr:PAS domain-containing sensor histidine kinase [Pseudomonas sp. OIL-1]QIB51775.1 PAS domain S-box protein [Pseudomonas sp. OIL-1]